MYETEMVLQFFINQVEYGRDPEDEHKYWLIARNALSNGDELINELITCINHLTNDSSLLAITNSYKDTLPSSEVLICLKDWNEKERLENEK